MAKGKKRPAELPEYGTVMMKGVQYYRTRITDADGKRVAIYGLTREELYDRVEDAQKKIAEVVFHRENPTVEEYCEKWLLMRSGTVRTNTLEGYACQDECGQAETGEYSSGSVRIRGGKSG